MEPTRAPNHHYSSLPDSEKIQKAITALAALETEPEIVAAMAARKYVAGEKKMNEGHALLQAARAFTDDQTEDTGNRLSATRSQNDRLADARALWAPLAATARVLFRDDPDVLAALRLKGRHSNAYAARIDRYRAFAVEARKPERLARFTDETDDIDATDFDALDAALDTAEAGMTAQDLTESRSEDTSEARRKAFKALEKWMLTMQGHARVVLRGRPQLLEMLGVSPRR